MRILFFFLMLLPITAAAEVPTLTARINDYAGFLQPETRSRLEQQLAELEQQDGTQLALLTITSLKGMTIEEYSLQAAEKWGLGQKGLDNGALLVIARDDRKMRIEVGYGLEDRLTDLLCGRIIRSVLVPEFKKENYEQGISAGLETMISVVQGKYSASTTDSPNSVEDLAGFAIFMIAVMLSLGNLFRKRKRLAGLAGAVALPLFSVIFFGVQMPLLLLLIPGGFFIGFIASLMAANTGSSGSSRGGFHSGSGFGRGSSFGGGGGGFRGGGGGFGGGGASGSW